MDLVMAFSAEVEEEEEEDEARGERTLALSEVTMVVAATRCHF